MHDAENAAAVLRGQVRLDRLLRALTPRVGPVPTHPLWRPYELADLDEVANARSPGRRDRRWCPTRGLATEARLPACHDALGDRVLALSTSARPPRAGGQAGHRRDLTVADSADEAAYVPDLEAAGFTLRIREPEWEEHRVLALEEPSTNLHVFYRGTSPRTLRILTTRSPVTDRSQGSRQNGIESTGPVGCSVCPPGP